MRAFLKRWRDCRFNAWADIMLVVIVALTVSSAGCSTGNKESVRQAAAPASLSSPPAAATQASVPARDQNVAPQELQLQELSVREDHGQTTLFLKFSRPVTQFRHFPLPQPSRVIVDVLGKTKGPLQAESFRVDTHWVGTLRVSSTEDSIRLAADITAATVPSYNVEPDNGGLKIVIGAIDEKATAKKTLTLMREGARLDVKTAEAVNPFQKKPGGGSDQPLTSEKKYTGQKISLEFKDADIKNVFRLLAEVSGLNIIVTNDVTKKVTVRLVEVPWDQALDLIIDTNGLGSEQIGNVVRISTAGTLKAEKDALIAANKSKEDLEPLQTVYFNVNYAKVKDLEPKIKTLLSKRLDAALVVDERSNTIMVRDLQKTIDDVNALVSRLDLRTAQILIESNLVETTPTFSRALGTEIDAIFNNRILASSRFLAGSPFAGSANTVAPPFPVPSTGFRFGFTPANLNGFITAAENEGNAKIISRPSVVTLNNVPSTIKSERILRIALPSSTNIASGSGAAAGTAVATEKIPVGINLTVTPQVSSDGFVLMNIKVKSSSIANSSTVSGGTAGVIPFDELNREAEANVLVRDGETIVIGGILKDIDSNSQSGVPYLKDIPVFGWLFRNWRFQKDFEELVVFITPRIAAAGSENLPTADELWRKQLEKTRADQAPSSKP